MKSITPEIIPLTALW